MDGHRFYSSPNVGNMDQWNQRVGNLPMNPPGANANFIPNGFRQQSNFYIPQQQQTTQRWNDDMGGAATKSWSQQGPRDEHKERELFSCVNSGINFDKYEEIPVEASGSDVPRPCASFDELSLHVWIQENIKKSGYTKPTPVQ
ncbi:unnamed protein product, partial [Anisakis simplex]|uniref:RNA helicase n=1 Tax=Anisakis simplex TaxID=6269 RepID=A0A0M3J7Q4_ANISI